MYFEARLNGTKVASLRFLVTNTPNGVLFDDYTAPGAGPSDIGITQFNLTTKDFKTKAKGKTVHFLTNPTSCPKAGWKFTQTDTLSSGPLSASSYAPCTSG